ncbi:MAG: RluA family pseudouridine synthase [Firmicutes bacterium]|nr:RluA family pseudouridine synthase [Bacillota bacterium]
MDEIQKFVPMIVFEDNHIVVAIKPHNLPSQQDESGDFDMLSAIKAYIGDKYKKPGNVFIGLVHRLDRPTGGLMVFARTSKAADRICEQIKQGEMGKKYMTVVQGVPKHKADRLEHYLKKDTKNNLVTLATALEQDSKKAILDYKVLESNTDTNPAISLLQVQLHTGRSHQIRVQMRTIGHAVFGDTKYGSAVKGGQNLALWAYELSFVHPTTKQNMRFVAYPSAIETPWNHFNMDKFASVYKPDGK